MLKKPFLFILCLCTLLLPASLSAQEELAAVLEVNAAGVEVRRVNTEQWIPVSVEAIVGVGDSIRTDDSGRATIIFFADGTETDLLPNTEYRIDQFTGGDDAFSLSVSVLAGQTTQRLNRLLNPSSSYDINTPAMELIARGTVFRVRVEDSGRAAMLVDEGEVAAQGGEEAATVPPGFGLRAEVGQALSDVVPASDFARLDAALDGCGALITMPDDVQMNVRSAPGRDFALLGTIPPEELSVLLGTVPGTGWYRIAFAEGFGWVLASTVTIAPDCAGLREFPPDFQEGDPLPASPEAESSTSE